LTTRADLIQQIECFETSYSEELEFIRPFIELLASPRSFHRDHLPGHITGSAWIIDESHTFALLTHHAKLDRWLQPGGHADGDENIIRVCTKEATEETGLQSLKLFSDKIFDIDIHKIPERKGFPEHLHYDVRLLFTASMNEMFIVTSESHDLSWIRLNDIAAKTENNKSMVRMAEKTKKLFRTD
jgi:8-oxo-dGTP pyrophosphatase MutT (NUDIX family)